LVDELFVALNEPIKLVFLVSAEDMAEVYNFFAGYSFAPNMFTGLPNRGRGLKSWVFPFGIEAGFAV